MPVPAFARPFARIAMPAKLVPKDLQPGKMPVCLCPLKSPKYMSCHSTLVKSEISCPAPAWIFPNGHMPNVPGARAHQFWKGQMPVCLCLLASLISKFWWWWMLNCTKTKTMQNIYSCKNLWITICFTIKNFFSNFQFHEKIIGFLKLINLHNYDNCSCYLAFIHLQYIFSCQLVMDRVPKTWILGLKSAVKKWV